MLSVIVSCNELFYPADERMSSPTDRPRQKIAPYQKVTTDLAQALPDLILDNAPRLDLDDDEVLARGVQVDIKKFHGCGMNNVDIKICVQFTGFYPDEDTAIAVRTELIALLREQLQLSEKLQGFEIDELAWALEIYWGPSHGHLVFPPGKPEVSW